MSTYRSRHTGSHIDDAVDLAVTALQPSDVTDDLTVSGKAADAKTVGDAMASNYTKPVGGIPKSDLALTVQQSLNKADTSLQSSDVDGTLSIAGKPGDAKSVGDAINAINEDDTYFRNSIALLYDLFTFVLITDKYWVASGIAIGKSSDSNGWSRTNRISCTPGETLIIKSTAVSTYNVFFNTDTDGDVNSTFSVGVGESVITVPTGAYYFGLSNRTEAMNNTQIFRIMNPKIINESVNKANADIQKLSEGISPVKYIPISREYISKNDGSVTSYTSWSRSDYIPVKANEIIHYSNTVSSAYNAFYDSNKAFVSAFTLSVDDDGTVNVPGDAEYMRISNTTEALAAETLWRNVGDFERTPVSIEIVNPYYFDRCTGDIVEGEPLTKHGGFIRFDGINIKTLDGNTLNLSWSGCKSDLASVISGNASVAVRSSYDFTPDCIMLLKNLVLIYDLDALKFDIVGLNGNNDPPKHYIVLYGCDSNEYPYGRIYDEAAIRRNQGIENYYSEIVEKEASVLACGDSFLFSFVTDVHYFTDKTSGYHNSTNEIVAKLDNDLCLDACLNGGDLILTGSKDMIHGIGSITQTFDLLNEDKTVCCVGNHDFNSVGGNGVVQSEDWLFDGTTIETLIMRHNKHISRPQGKRYFYRDFTDKKVRIIVLDTQDVDVTFDSSGDVELDPGRVYGIRQAQIDWLCGTALNVPANDWNIIIVMHVGLYSSSEGFTANSSLVNREAVRGILEKFVDKDAYSYSNTDTTYDGYFTVSVSGDFSGYHGNLVAVFSGHGHEDSYLNTNGFNAIQTICSYPDVGDHSSRAVRTISEAAIDVGYIDTANRKIILKRFGYGNDREYSY